MRLLVLGPGGARHATPARLPGQVAVAAGPLAALRAADGCAEGLVLTVAAAARARLDGFAAQLGYRAIQTKVETDQGPAAVTLYRAAEDPPADAAPWDLQIWAARDKPLVLQMAREVSAYPDAGAAPLGLLRRAVARLRAAEGAPAALRSDFGDGVLTDHRVTRTHAGFFAGEVHRFRHRRFGGDLSPEVNREVFVTGDAVSVLPWDPRRDSVLLIEQIRSGLIARGDPNPMNLEVIAGICDRNEDPTATARREAREEAGLDLGRIVEVGRYYTSPGALTEFVIGFLAEADLGDVTTGIFGLDTEHEDIRRLVVPRREAMAALARGEARNAPLILSLLELERRADGLAAEWARVG